MSNPTSSSSPTRSTGLPLVVQVGFAGARELFDPPAHPGVDPAVFETAVQEQLISLLRRLPQELNLGPQFFLCGISQIAIGGDTVFTRACEGAGMMQRIFLPQPREEYLNAVGSAGPDFTAGQKATARQLLASPHIIQERVVSDAADRHDRFHDANLEIVRVSDVLVCLVGAEGSSRRGGTGEVIKLASKRGHPVLEIQVDVASGAPVLTPGWHGREDFKRPALPGAIAGATSPKNAPNTLPPSVADYVRGLKNLASRRANWERKLFKTAAFIIIGAHVFATVIAVLALTQHDTAVASLLFIELLLLATGFGVHQYVHRTHRLEHWALARLAAEVARSVAAIGRFHVYLSHLFTLPFPSALRPLLRTISVLHLYSTARATRGPWEPQRDTYVKERLVSREANAQIPYNKRTKESALKRLKIARRAFFWASVLAFSATLIKLLVVRYLPVGTASDWIAFFAGILAVVLPVIAVAALSLAAAFDLEARFATSKEMLAFLDEQKTLLENASSAREYSRLLIETESRLLGETVNWYARRSFVGVA